jgi:hypothetical protein
MIGPSVAFFLKETKERAGFDVLAHRAGPAFIICLDIKFQSDTGCSRTRAVNNDRISYVSQDVL